MKMVTLFVVFNSQAAALTSLLLSAALGFAEVYVGAHVLPLNLWVFCGLSECFWKFFPLIFLLYVVYLALG